MSPGTNTPSSRPVVEKELDFQRWVHLIAEHRWWIAGVTTLFVTLAAVYSFLATPIYSATAMVYVTSQSRQTIGNSNLVGATSWMEEQKFYNSQEQIIRGRAVMQEVVDKLGLASKPPFKGARDPARMLMSMTKVEAVRDSALFKITVQAPDKVEVAIWANKIAEIYADQNVRHAMEYVRKANQEMQRQILEMQEQYTRQQQKYSTTLAQSDSYFPENQKEILDKRIESLELKLNDVRMKQNELSAQVGQMQSWSAGGGNPLSIPTVSQDPSVQNLSMQYNEMERELNKLLSKFTPQHPEVQKKQGEMRSLKERIASQAQIVLSSYRNQYSALRGEEANLNAELAGLKRQGLAFVEGSTQTEGMATSGQSLKKYIDLIYDKMRELDVASNLISNNIRVVEPAIEPVSPVKPNKKANITLALMLGFFLSVGMVVAQQYLDTRIKSVEDIEQVLGQNLLTMVPSMSEESERSSVEAFQTLRTALMYASQNRQQNCLLVTSANPREGKSTVALNLAGTLAAAGDRVLLMDCDLRRPSLHRKIKQTDVAGRGLTHYMANPQSRPEEFLTQKGPNLWLFFAGPIPPNPPELFSMKRFADLVAKMKQDFDWVIMDSPPCLSITDAQILAAHGDLVVMVARYKSTQKPLLERSLITLERVGAQVAGIVMNDVNKQSSYYYDYYYANHYYYSTGAQPKRLPWLLGKRGDWKDVGKKESGL